MRANISDVLVVNEAVTKEVAVIELAVVVDNDVIRATGTAKRHPSDKPDMQTAALLAWGRAFDSLSRKFMRRANGKVRHSDQLKARKLAIANCQCDECVAVYAKD